MRMVVDLADFNRSVWVNSTGESGHAYHPNYADQIDAWAAGESFPWPFTPDAVKAASEAELSLRPPGGQATSTP